MREDGERPSMPRFGSEALLWGSTSVPASDCNSIRAEPTLSVSRLAHRNFEFSRSVTPCDVTTDKLNIHVG